VYLADLNDSRRLDHGRFFLPLGKLHCFFVIGVNACEFLAVLVEHSDLPVTVLAPLVLTQLCSFSFLQWSLPEKLPEYLNCARVAQVPARLILLR